MPVKKQIVDKARAQTSPQPCRFCNALADEPCKYTYAGKSVYIAEVHIGRQSSEFGAWTQKYDARYRDRTLGFGRRKAELARILERTPPQKKRK